MNDKQKRILAPREQTPGGFVLPIALVFLVVLTLVAITAVKGTGLELRMSANNALHTEAFEASEGPRLVVGRLIEKLGFNFETGWPAAIGGGTPDAVFAYTVPTGIQIYNSSGTAGGTPLNWFTGISESTFAYNTFAAKARYNITNVASASTSTLPLTAVIDVQRARTAPKTGCDLGSGGYDGVSSRNCADYIFLITSRGDAPGGSADYETSSMYRYIPR